MQNQEIRLRRGLSIEELQEIRRLADICEQHDGIHLKLNWEMLKNRSLDETNDFLCYQDGRLIGCLALYWFGSPEIELNGMVHPSFRRDRVFSRLLGEARAECRRRGIPKLVFICDRDSTLGAAVVTQLGAHYTFSEYGMEMTEYEQPVSFTSPDLHFKPAGAAEAQDMARLDSACFDYSLEEARLDTGRIGSGLLALYEEKPVGKVFIVFAADGAFIFGLCVLPEYQGRGFGRAILREAIRVIRTKTDLPVRLEVACENSRALGLYYSCGFKAVTVYDYYALEV